MPTTRYLSYRRRRRRKNLRLALLLRALLTMYHSCQKHVFAVCIMLAAFACVAVLQMNTIVVLLGCAVAGVLYTMAKEGTRS